MKYMCEFLIIINTLIAFDKLNLKTLKKVKKKERKLEALEVITFR